MRLVLDTNIWISGILLPKSPPEQLVHAWREGAIGIVVSQAILQEIERVLLYPKIIKRIGWAEAKVKDYVAFIALFAEHVDNVESHWVHVERDPNDSAILATLLASKADVLITGDNDLLVLKNLYPIMTPAEFFERRGHIA